LIYSRALRHRNYSAEPKNKDSERKICPPLWKWFGEHVQFGSQLNEQGSGPGVLERLGEVVVEYREVIMACCVTDATCS
jgi:hypothetical protein